jgi:hypothetical protein
MRCAIAVGGPRVSRVVHAYKPSEQPPALRDNTSRVPMEWPRGLVTHQY